MPLRIQLQETFKLALSLTLFYWLALWMDWYLPKYGALAIVLVSLGTTGASLNKGIMRLVGTTAGIAVGLLGLALFAQDRWLTLLFLSSYLVVVGYFMPVSRYGYAWYVAGFLPPLLWSTTYGDVEGAFHYASFRYLETSAGIIIYTLVSALLWPRSAGAQLDQQGNELWPGLRELFGLYRRQLTDGELPAKAPALASQLAGTTSRMAATLQAAYVDTPSVMAAKREWEVYRVNVRALGDALALWRESIDDARRLDLNRLLPELKVALDTLDRRLFRIGDLRRSRSTWGDVPDTDTDDRDSALLESLAVQLDREVARGLPHLDRAALLGFVQQLETLDLTSREVLRTMRVLAGLASRQDGQARSLPPDLYRPSRWDPSRLVGGLFPALCFAAAYVFWIYTDPPSGPSVPSMAATLALMFVLTPMRALALLPGLMLVMWGAVAPVYFLVMPQLDSGFGLLVLIFGYTFAAGLIGGRSPMTKTWLLLLFVMMTGISNEQTYSFMGLVNGGMMFVLSLVIIAVVQLLMSPNRPEQILLSSVRRFFRGCARITGEFAAPDAERGRALRKLSYESMVLPVPGRLQAVAVKLDYQLFPENDQEKVQRLLSGMQNIAYRLQALELAHAHVARRAVEWAEPLALLGKRLRERLQHLFETWSRLQPIDATEERAALQGLATDMASQLDASMKAASPDLLDDEALTDLYAVLGCARGLVHAAATTQVAATQINWGAWDQARF